MSIFGAMDGLADDFLLVQAAWDGLRPKYKHEGSLQMLSELPASFASHNVVDVLFASSRGLWDEAIDSSGRPRLRSKENWRCLKCKNVRRENNSPEVRLERIIATCTEKEWWNQVPVNSGLLGSRRSRYIDLIHRDGNRYSIFELKAAEGDTPLSAAIQVLQYGVSFLFFRECVAPTLPPRSRPEIVKAEQLNLVVLAPHSYYHRRSIKVRDWLCSLERRLQQDLQESAIAQASRLDMSFHFESFPQDFDWGVERVREVGIDDVVHDALIRRVRLWPT